MFSYLKRIKQQSNLKQKAKNFFQKFRVCIGILSENLLVRCISASNFLYNCTILVLLHLATQKRCVFYTFKYTQWKEVQCQAEYTFTDRVVNCRAVSCRTVQCSWVRSVVQCSVVQDSVLHCFTYTKAQCLTVQCSVEHCSAVPEMKEKLN